MNVLFDILYTRETALFVLVQKFTNALNMNPMNDRLWGPYKNIFVKINHAYAMGRVILTRTIFTCKSAFSMVVLGNRLQGI